MSLQLLDMMGVALVECVAWWHTSRHDVQPHGLACAPFRYGQDAISFNSCITACERGSLWQEALACLHAGSSVCCMKRTSPLLLL